MKRIASMSAHSVADENGRPRVFVDFQWDDRTHERLRFDIEDGIRVPATKQDEEQHHEAQWQRHFVAYRQLTGHEPADPPSLREECERMRAVVEAACALADSDDDDDIKRMNRLCDAVDAYRNSKPAEPRSKVERDPDIAATIAWAHRAGADYQTELGPGNPSAAVLAWTIRTLLDETRRQPPRLTADDVAALRELRDWARSKWATSPPSTGITALDRVLEGKR